MAWIISAARLGYLVLSSKGDFFKGGIKSTPPTIFIRVKGDEHLRACAWDYDIVMDPTANFNQESGFWTVAIIDSQNIEINTKITQLKLKLKLSTSQFVDEIYLQLTSQFPD